MSRVRLAELCGATALFTSMGTGQPSDHGLRTCLVAMRLADRLGVDPSTAREIYYVTLLRFLGCTADSAETADAAGGDELALFAGLAPVTMGSPREELAQMVRAVAPGQGLSRRARLILAMLADRAGKDRLLGAHCEVAAQLAGEMALPDGVADGLAAAYARWDGSGTPAGVAGTDIPLPTRVAIVARDLELWSRETDLPTTTSVLEARAGRAYDPAIVEAATRGGLDDLRSLDGDPWDLVLELEPSPHLTLTGEHLTRALGALADFADLKSPDFTGHGRRVAALARDAAIARGHTTDEVDLIERAALVHDLGVTGVPSGVWSAPRSLTSSEWEQVRLHPMWTTRLLRRCRGLEEVAELAGSTHERLDGSGYPAGRAGGMPPGWGLVAAADLFDEHRSPRGYRAARDPDRITSALGTMVTTGLLHHDGVAAVVTAAGQAAPIVSVERPAGLTEREVDVLQRLARGRTNREIATDLGISPKTVGTHLEHVYAKAGVRSRAAATVFAMQHGLVD